VRHLTRLIATGTPEEVGHLHGSTFSEAIRTYADVRIRLSAEGTELDRRGILEIGERMLEAHHSYDPELFDEMIAMARAAGISPAEAVIVGG